LRSLFSKNKRWRKCNTQTYKLIFFLICGTSTSWGTFTIVCDKKSWNSISNKAAIDEIFSTIISRPFPPLYSRVDVTIPTWVSPLVRYMTDLYVRKSTSIKVHSFLYTLYIVETVHFVQVFRLYLCAINTIFDWVGSALIISSPESISIFSLVDSPSYLKRFKSFHKW
jgi:hypothetical protein